MPVRWLARFETVTESSKRPYPVATRSSRIELRRECRQNSPDGDFERCNWSGLAECNKSLLKATMVAIRGPGVRVSLGRMKLKMAHISSIWGDSSFAILSNWCCSPSQAWQNRISRAITSDDFWARFAAMAQGILPMMFSTSDF